MNMNMNIAPMTTTRTGKMKMYRRQREEAVQSNFLPNTKPSNMAETG